jgi:hypothetical protein
MGLGPHVDPGRGFVRVRRDTGAAVGNSDTANASTVRNGSESRPPKVRRGSDGRSFRVRSRSTNDPVYLPKQPNPRAQDRRPRDLVEAFMTALGGPSVVVNELTQVAVRKAAELLVLAEATRAAMLNGAQIDITALIRIEGEARHACRALGLKFEPAPPKTTPAGLRFARERWAQAEATRLKRAEASTQNTTEPDDGRTAAK